MGELSLPSEVWTHVFKHLRVEDKQNVRACCKHFKRLVDHASLWKDWVVVLGTSPRSYNNQFWTSLRRRKVKSAVVRNKKADVWKHLTHFLPDLNSLALDQNIQNNLKYLRHLPGLTCLVLTRSTSSVQLDASMLSKPDQLTSLTICGVKLQSSQVDGFISAISAFKNLTSLTCHENGIIGNSLWMIQSILACLPKLARLSLTTVDQLYAAHCRVTPSSLQTGHGQNGAPVLSSLELLDCRDDSLPNNVMRLVPNLKKLTIVYSNQEWGFSWASGTLRAWLQDLSQLSSLVVFQGPPVHHYAHLIPATVTNLVLSVSRISSVEMITVARRLPDLRHLHIDSWRLHLGALTAKIPELFPKLKSLKLRYELVVDKYLLEVHKIKELKYLELLTDTPCLGELTEKLQILTSGRLRVGLYSHQRDPLACSCVSHPCT